jgi:hypothetical protein
VIVALLEHDLELDTREELGRRPEHEGIAAWLEVGGQLADAAVGVGLASDDDLMAASELDAYA